MRYMQTGFYSEVSVRPSAALLVAVFLVCGGACRDRRPSPGRDAGAVTVDTALAQVSVPALPPGAFHVLAPLADTQAVDACTSDRDCLVAALRCCGCAQNGLGVAIAASMQKEWAAASCAQPTSCADGVTSDPSCRAVARCHAGHCRLTVEPGNL